MTSPPATATTNAVAVLTTVATLATATCMNACGVPLEISALCKFSIRTEALHERVKARASQRAGESTRRWLCSQPIMQEKKKEMEIRTVPVARANVSEARYASLTEDCKPDGEQRRLETSTPAEDI